MKKLLSLLLIPFLFACGSSNVPAIKEEINEEKIVELLEGVTEWDECKVEMTIETSGEGEKAKLSANGVFNKEANYVKSSGEFSGWIYMVSENESQVVYYDGYESDLEVFNVLIAIEMYASMYLYIEEATIDEISKAGKAADGRYVISFEEGKNKSNAVFSADGEYNYFDLDAEIEEEGVKVKTSLKMWKGHHEIKAPNTANASVLDTSIFG